MRLAEFSHFRSKFQREDEWSTLSPRQIVWGWSDGWDIMRHWPARQVKDSPRHKGAQGERRLNAGWLLWTVLCISQVAGTIMKTAHVFFLQNLQPFLRTPAFDPRVIPQRRWEQKNDAFFLIEVKTQLWLWHPSWCVAFRQRNAWMLWSQQRNPEPRQKKTRRWKGWPKIYTWWKLVHQLDTPKKLFTLR